MRHKHSDTFTPKERAQALVKEQKNLERLAESGELVRVSLPFTIPRELMDRSKVTSTETVRELLRLAEEMPTKEAARAHASESADELPFFHLLGRSTLSSGKVVGESEGGDKNLELAMERNLSLVANALGKAAVLTLLGGVERSGLAVADLVHPLRALTLEADTLALLGHGIQRALDKDWISATHILTIQCEPVLRQILKAGGFVTTKLVPDVGDGTSRTDDLAIGGLLSRSRDDGMTAREYIGEDLAWRFNSILASQTGLNLRNAVAHGSMPTKAFTGEAVGITLLLLYGLAARFKAGVTHQSALES